MPLLKVFMVPVIEATEMSQEVEDWCVEHDFSTHGSTELYCLCKYEKDDREDREKEDDHEILFKWLREQGINNEYDEYGRFWFGIVGS